MKRKIHKDIILMMRFIITSLLFVICLIPLSFSENFISVKIEYPIQFGGLFLGFAILYSFCFILSGHFTDLLFEEIIIKDKD